MYWAFWKFCIPIMIFLFVFLPCLFSSLISSVLLCLNSHFFSFSHFQSLGSPFFRPTLCVLPLIPALPFIAVLPSIFQPFFWPFSESLLLYISYVDRWQGSWPTASVCQRWKSLRRCSMRSCSLTQCRQTPYIPVKMGCCLLCGPGNLSCSEQCSLVQGLTLPASCYALQCWTKTLLSLSKKARNWVGFNTLPLHFWYIIFSGQHFLSLVWRRRRGIFSWCDCVALAVCCSKFWLLCCVTCVIQQIGLQEMDILKV